MFFVLLNTFDTYFSRQKSLNKITLSPWILNCFLVIS